MAEDDSQDKPGPAPGPAVTNARARFVEAACRAYWGRAWDTLPNEERINHRAGVMRTMEYLKKQGWATPTQRVGTQFWLAAHEAQLERLGGLIRKVNEDATEPLPEDF